MQVRDLIRAAWENSDRWFVLGLLACSLGLNVYLGRHFDGASANRTGRVLKLGDALSPLSGIGIDGLEHVIVSPSDKRNTIVYIFTPSCV